MVLPGLLGVLCAASVAGAASSSEPTPVEDLGPSCGTFDTPLQSVIRDTDPDHVELDNMVIVTPRVDVERDLQAGDAFTCLLMIRNRRPATTTFQLEPYGVIGSKSPNTAFEFVGADDERFGATAGPWLEPLVPDVTIPPRGVVRVPVKVTIPDDPPVGSAYGSVNVVSRTRASAGENVLGIESQAATIFLLRVGGEGRPDLGLGDVEAPRLRWNRDPWTLTANLDNDGTLHATSSGRVRVRSLFGNVVAELPIDRETILPGGREPIAATWKGVPWIGLYRYDVRVENGPATEGDTPPTSVATADGWFVALPPWWVLALVAALLVVLVVRWWRNRGEDHAWADESGDEFDDEPEP